MLQARAREAAKLSVLESARLEVETYENQLEVLLSVHKEQGEEWNWKAIEEAPPPLEPVREERLQKAVEGLRAAYRPGLIDKLLGRAKRQEAKFQSELDSARIEDERHYALAKAQYEQDLATWEDERRLATGVLTGDSTSYSRVLRDLTPFAELSDLGSSLTYRIHSSSLIEALVKVNAEQAIPSQMKSLTSSGKLTTKAMPKSRFHEIYQDHVCGAVLRVGREVFALLPAESVLVTALADVFDTRTGRTAEQPILSVALTRAAMSRLNFDRLDPSDSMENFVHRGDFKASRRTGAFVPIIPLTPAEIETPAPSPVLSRSLGATTSTASPSVNPFPARWAEALRRNEIEYGFLRLTVNDLANLLGRRPQENFTLPESRSLAQAVEQFGYCLEPDPRHGAGAFRGQRDVGLFQPSSGNLVAPSEGYLGASALLQLCLVVAASDGAVDRSELDQFRRFVESQFRFTPDEQQRLVVLETLLSRDTSPAKVTLGRTAKRIPEGKQIVVARFLVDVAAADGVISPREHRALCRIFETLGLDTADLDSIVRSLPTSWGTVVLEEKGTTTTGEAIQPPASTATAGGLKLDMARVAAISAETHEVIGLLAKAMAEDANETERPAPGPWPSGRPTVAVANLRRETEGSNVAAIQARAATDAASGASGIPPAKLAALDTRYHAVLHRLLERDEWPRRDFEDVAREHRLFPMGLIDAVNEWADGHLGDFLIQGDDPIAVDRSLLEP